MIAQIIINSNVKNLNKIFDYNVPTDLEGTICVGDRVLVPFGNKKTFEEGFVIGLKEKTEYKVKDIVKIQNEIKLTKENIELAKLMAKRYFCNISDCIKLMLPPGTISKNIENRIKDKKQRFVSRRSITRRAWRRIPAPSWRRGHGRDRSSGRPR